MPTANLRTPQEIADQFGLTRNQVYDLVQRRAIPYIRLGSRRVLINPDDMAAYLDGQRVEAKEHA